MTHSYGRRRAVTAVQYTGLPSTIDVPVKIVVKQRWNTHDIVEIHYQQTQPWMASLKTGVPVRVSWGNSLGSASIYGYVSHTSAITTTTVNQPAKVVCVGSSWPLKETGNEVWADHTAPQIATLIARRFGLQIIADPSPMVIPQITQAGRSYWSVLVDLADRSGYLVQMRGTALVFRSRDSLIDAGMSSAPMFSMGAGRMKNAGIVNPERGLWHFRPKVGEYIETEGNNPLAVQHVSGVDPVTGAVVTATTSPSGITLRSVRTQARFDAFPIDRVVGSSYTAALTAKAKAEAVRMSIPADAVATGDARARPGVPVYIHGTGSATDGYWVVEEAEHEVYTAGEYELGLRLRTDSLGNNNSAGAFRPTSPPNRPLRDLTKLDADIRPVLTPRLSGVAVGTPTNDRRWTIGGSA